jgi:cell division protein FtsX
MDCARYWGSCCQVDPIRQTRSAYFQFYICTVRAFKQIFNGFGPFVLEMMLHLLCGAVISSAANRLYFVGPFPDPVCAVTLLPFQNDCINPQVTQYVQVANFMCFGVIFAAVASASATFGHEQVNYYRESSSGLQSMPYFFGKWLANLPRIIFAALFFWIAFSIKYQNTGRSGDLYLIILFLYWFGFSMGYVTSQLVPYAYCALTGVLIALIFAVALAGANPNMAKVESKPRAQQFFWMISGPRWALEAFYISGVSYYEHVPAASDGFGGQPYEDIAYGLDNVGYNVGNFYMDIHGLFWVGFAWGIFALLLMVCTSRDKKK